MSHEYLNTRSSHPARDASIRSIEAVLKGDKQAWLDNFHAEATVEDPVGVSPRQSFAGCM